MVIFDVTFAFGFNSSKEQINHEIAMNKRQLSIAALLASITIPGCSTGITDLSPSIESSTFPPFPRAPSPVEIVPSSSEEEHNQGIRHELNTQAIDEGVRLAANTYAGAWIDEVEEPHIAVTTEKSKERIETEITYAPIHVHVVTHTWDQLKSAMDAATEHVLGDHLIFPGAEVGIDEPGNKVTVLIPNPEKALKALIEAGDVKPSNDEEYKAELQKITDEINKAESSVRALEQSMIKNKSISAPILDIRTNQDPVIPVPLIDAE